MTPKLLIQAISKFLTGIALVAVLVFVPAGTIDFKNGWIFMSVLFIPMLLAGIILFARNPKLLARRLNAKEKQAEQQLVVKLSGLMFLAGFILAGLDHRYGWTHLPDAVVIIAAVIFLAGYAMYAEVLRENTYLSRTIEVTADQKVIDTGLYGIVRHPMYLATVVMFMAIPLILGSLISFLVFCAYPLLIAARIRNEEKVLEAELPGYTEYKLKVKYRMIPFIW